MNQYSIAVVGNPNCGKSTVFNGITGTNQRVGNWPGVTVEKKIGTLIGLENVELVDLPGIYSLNAGSEDEIIARNHILSEDTDLIINIVDASNIERNLFLTMTLLEMEKPVLLVLSMKDIAEKRGIVLDIEALSNALDIPAMAINTLDGTDIRNLRRKIKECLGKLKPTKSPVLYPDIIEKTIEEWSLKIKSHPRQTALMLLEEDEEIHKKLVESKTINADEIQKKINAIGDAIGETPDIAIAEAKFECIKELLSHTRKIKKGVIAFTEKVDKFVLNRWLGIPIFMIIMYLLFWVVTHIGGAFIDFFDILSGAIFVDGISVILVSINAPPWLIALLAGGVGVGIQTVFSFIPIVASMFMMLSILEDSGYMARAAFVMDRLMRSIGLPGKAFVPMLVGFGCTVPAVMATRTLENKKDRYLTVFMAPLMSCGARLPVYALFGVAFFGSGSSIMIFAIYMFGVLLAVFTGLLLKNTLFRGEVSHFVMELPPYHAFRMRVVMAQTWQRLRIFIFRAGKMIVIAVLFLSFINSLGVDGSFGNHNNENSVLSVFGKSISPIFSPMGLEEDNWPAAVALLSGMFAKEVIVGTMTGLYGQMATVDKITQEEKPTEAKILPSLKDSSIEAIRSIKDNVKELMLSLKDPLGLSLVRKEKSVIVEKIGTKSTTFNQLRMSFRNEWTRAFSYLIFVLIYFPCFAAFATITREIGTGYGWLAIVYLTILAWSVSTLFFQMSSGHNVIWGIFAVALVALFIPIFNLISGRWKLPGIREKSFVKKTDSN